VLGSAVAPVCAAEPAARLTLSDSAHFLCGHQRPAQPVLSPQVSSVPASRSTCSPHTGAGASATRAQQFPSRPLAPGTLAEWASTKSESHAYTATPDAGRRRIFNPLLHAGSQVGGVGMFAGTNWIVVGSILAVVLGGHGLFLVVVWLEYRRSWEPATSRRASLRQGMSASGTGGSGAPPCASARSRGDVPTQDLRVYALLRAARNAHRLPEVPQPHVVEWLLSQAGYPSSVGQPGHSQARSRSSSPLIHMSARHDGSVQPDQQRPPALERAIRQHGDRLAPALAAIDAAGGFYLAPPLSDPFPVGPSADRAWSLGPWADDSAPQPYSPEGR
jgi:hypothetical protein